MELIVLGASGTWPYPDGATSGYLVKQDGYCLWLDAGTGTMARLQDHIGLEKVDAVLISHEHPDHYVDLYPFFYARYYGEIGTHHIPFRAPVGFFDLCASVVSEASQVAMRTAFDALDVEAGSTFELGPFRIEAHQMEHLGLNALGYRIEGEEGVLAYTGDTGPTEEIDALARDADLLLSEATWQDANDLLPFHLSARQAAAHAKSAGARRLVLTHIWPSLEKQTSLEQAADVFDGPIELASEGARLTVSE